MIRLVLFFLLIIQTPKALYSFYDFYGDLPFQYRVTFTGTVIFETRHMSYTNTNGEFSIIYVLETRSDFSAPNQIVTDWYFSEMMTTNLPSILPSVWRAYISKKQKEIAYIVKLDTDHFYVFNRNGELHPLTYIMDVFFPVIDQSKTMYEKQYHVPNSKNTRDIKDYLNINITGWDFFKYTRPLNSRPYILMETNELLINQIYQNYSSTRKAKKETLFWLQSIIGNKKNAYDQLLSDMELTGMYFIDLRERLLTKATVLGKTFTKLPYEDGQYKENFNLYLEGAFNIELLHPVSEGSSNSQHVPITVDNFFNITSEFNPSTIKKGN